MITANKPALYSEKPIAFRLLYPAKFQIQGSFLCLNRCRRAEQFYWMRRMNTKEPCNKFQDPDA